MKATKLFKEFFDSEKAGGIVLIACTIFFIDTCQLKYWNELSRFFQTQFAGHSTEHWINDGLMTIFFCSLAWN